MTHTRMQRSKKRRPRPFITGTLEEELFKSMMRSGSIILALSSFHGGCARDGMVLLWSHLKHYEIIVCVND